MFLWMWSRAKVTMPIAGRIVCLATGCRRDDGAPPHPSEKAEPATSVTAEPVASPEPYWVPSASVHPGAPSDLLGKDVQNPVYWYRKSARTCLPTDCTGKVAVEVEIQIATDGSVASSKTVKGDAKIGACLERLVRKRGPFPKSDAGGTFRIPFIFEC